MEYVRRKIRIAFVDDCPIQRLLLRQNIENTEEFELLLESPGGREMLNGLTVMPVLPEVCILDCHMPGMDGAMLASELTRLYPNILLIGHTASTDAEEHFGMLSRGARKIFNKGYNADMVSMLDWIRFTIIEEPSRMK